ncbi:MAG: polysaccharide biosynthesis protein [Nitrospirae bacterium]|nr:polysaccharide biosynthesis protein [Nitrospirota bacterium]
MRIAFFLIADIIIIIFSFFISFCIRFEFSLSFYNSYRDTILVNMPLFIIIKIVFLYVSNVYKMSWRYIGVADICKIVNALLLSESMLIVLIYYLDVTKYLKFTSKFNNLTFLPRSIIVIDGLITLILIFFLRILKRLYIEQLHIVKFKVGFNTIIIGAGNTGEMIIRDILRQKESKLKVIGFLDDDKSKINSYVHGVRVLGSTAMLSQIINKYSVKHIIIAIPNLPHKLLKEFYNICRRTGIETIKITPKIYDVDNFKITVNSLEDIKLEDILGRQIVNINFKHIATSLIGKNILITGAAGSIGSEIVNQICSFNDVKIILFDIDETGMYNIEMKIKKNYPHLIQQISFVIGDVKDKKRLEQVFSFYKPHIVFHSAAYKHVPLMEYNPSEAIKVNIFGTHNVAKIAIESAVDKFIMISTDKAINPSNIMGSTKYIAEKICKSLNGSTKFISVRFGNVLGSRGSVLPLFLEQLKEGGPLTVTHAEMKRYFMTIPEAVSLVLQASVIGNGGDVMLLDMGEAISILSIAEELIKLHGLEPYKDIDIKIIGTRPGEKLFEELFTKSEGIIASKHERIFIVRGSVEISYNEIEKTLKELHDILNNMSYTNDDSIKKYLKGIVFN